MAGRARLRRATLAQPNRSPAPRARGARREAVAGEEPRPPGGTCSWCDAGQEEAAAAAGTGWTSVLRGGVAVGVGVGADHGDGGERGARGECVARPGRSPAGGTPRHRGGVDDARRSGSAGGDGHLPRADGCAAHPAQHRRQPQRRRPARQLDRDTAGRAPSGAGNRGPARAADRPGTRGAARGTGRRRCPRRAEAVVIAKVSRGWGAGGLVRYLMGPGRFNEHTNQRVIASWDWAPELHQPPRDGSACGFDVRGLTHDLTLPAEAAGVASQRPLDEPTGRRGPVWHCSLRNAEGDRILTEAEWAEVAEDLMDRTGIAPRGDHGGCRWGVIRHADDHIHIAAMLVRQDNGRRVHPRNDYYRAAEVCRDAESRFGLTSPAPADRTAAPECTRAETEKAARRGAAETSREWLRRAARTAAVQATDPESFFRRLADLGAKVRPREMPPGHLVGYAVAAPGDVNADGRPVWFGGRRVGWGLSLPALLARWRSAPPAPDPIPPLPQEHSRVGQAERAAAVQQATPAAPNATDALHGDPQN